MIIVQNMSMILIIVFLLKIKIKSGTTFPLVKKHVMSFKKEDYWQYMIIMQFSNYY